MKTKSLRLPALITALVTLAVSGCQSYSSPASSSAPAPKPAAPSAPAAKPAPAMAAIRIKAGSSTGFTDSAGNLWLPEEGFEGGQPYDRTGTTFEGTKDSVIYATEHYSMTSFTKALPNGKYTVKLHFSEAYEGNNGKGLRVFDYKVGNKEFKDFDVWTKSGGMNHAYVETVEVEVTDGKLVITFTPKMENPQINGIEIIPHA
jgi:hypothetical protein